MPRLIQCARLSFTYMSTHPNPGKSTDASIEAMFNVGAHYGFIKSRRHPTVKPFIFGTKNKVEIFDLEKTDEQLQAAVEFVKKVAATGKQIVFAGSKSEAKEAVKKAAESVAQPFVAGRWVGGTFTNFGNIRKRVEKLLDLTSQREKGELTKYTKKERLMIDREIDRLNNLFNGITTMATLPGALFVVDSKKEYIAVQEARDMKIQVAEMARLERVLYEILSKATGHSVERIEKDCDRDNFMSAAEAKQYGLIDEVTLRNKTEPKK